MAATVHCWLEERGDKNSSCILPLLRRAFLPPYRSRQRGTGIPHCGKWKEPQVNAYSGPRYLKTPDAALRLGLSARTLEKHRCYGTGPVYRKLGGRIVYAIEDLDAWADIGRRCSTSDPGKGTIHPARPVRR